MFESGAGGNFDTYVGESTGSIYRMDLGKIHYQGLSAELLLADAQQKEGRLARIPDEIRCKICGTEFSAQKIPIHGEEVIDAYEL
jgi:hypothetical protein